MSAPAPVARGRTLRAPETGKTWASHCDGAAVRITQATGKPRQKDFPDPAAASAWAEKEEWSRLKKGMVLVAPDAAPGQPLLHRFVGGAYTGAMALCDFGGRLLCNRHEDSGEQLLAVDSEGAIDVLLEQFRDRLIWSAAEVPELGRILMRADHQVLALVPATGAMAELSPNLMPSFMSVAGTRVAWFDGTAVVVEDLATGQRLMRQPATPQLYLGHTTQMEGALSPDGRTLAFCAEAGEVRLFDVGTGAERPPWRGGFAMVRQLRFALGGQRLLMLEQYGRNTLHAFDLQSGAEPAGWPDLGELARADLAVDASGQQVVVTKGNRGTLYDAATMAPRLEFRIEHVVRRCVAAWIGPDRLSIRTDYGCASLYAIR
ncbi:WD40 repeat domain-containing protein [Methylobacterium brachythecii]|uniref:WD40 repeat domain-containing protein n=1 Tax=Methylobacterium brachythecii TaxID=1176177 RepID=A0A7W6AIX0_9HYPH|nr:hypothetical protein [Methylobacterium brachythecii]MBB3901994.1 hypothetical protein [Methylobacterium brachythecii]GLS43376.1 hypothetical protein GCM10007884_13610 [Methylobacterium brachythecii]